MVDYQENKHKKYIYIETNRGSSLEIIYLTSYFLCALSKKKKEQPLNLRKEQWLNVCETD
jgi:hypothetical protein